MQYLTVNLETDGKFGPLTRKAAVKCLQYWLNKQYGAGLAVDGGTGCLNAVKSFRWDRGLEVDGKAGPLTFEKLCKE